MGMDCAHEPGAQRHNNGGPLTFRNQQLRTEKLGILRVTIRKHETELHGIV